MGRNGVEHQQNHSRVEQSPNLPLQDWLRRHGIKSALFDFDETIIDTASIIEMQKRLYISHLMAELNGFNFDVLLSQLETLDEKYFDVVGVNPRRWEMVVTGMAGELGIDQTELFWSGLPILMQIYQTPPRLVEGAVETLDAFASTGINLGLVTHANTEWTNFKLDTLNLRGYFSQIVIADENGHKGHEDWLRAIQASGFSPENTLVVGDSLVSDIQASAVLGVRNLVWVNPKSNRALVPEGTIVIGNILGLIPKLIST